MFISVVMAVFNGEHYLKEAVESILNQTYPSFEVIIVNDGSTDHTKEILDSIHDKRVKVIHSIKNQGAAASLNMAIGQSTGNWIAVHDADDVSEPERLEEQVKYLKAHPGSIGAGSLIKTIPGKPAAPSFKIKEEKYYNRILPAKTVYNQRLYTCYLCHGTVIYAKEAFYKAGRYNPDFKISYDYNLWLRLFDIAPLEKIPKFLYNYRVSQDSLGKKDTKKTTAELMTISFSYLHNHLKKTLHQEPCIAVIGSKKGCQFFEQHVKTKTNLNTINFFSTREKKHLKQIHLLFGKGKIDAIVILKHAKTGRIIKFFKKLEMQWNENLFMIWNYKY